MAKAPRGGRRTGASRKVKDRAPSRSAAIGVIGIAALVVTGAWWHFTKAPGPTESAVATTVPNTSATDSSARATSTPEVLVGRWQRADGGYVLEIRSVGRDGTLDTGYFNPAPIHVSQARVTSTAGVIKAFVELRDVNYPGSTYTLTYDAANDLLVGEYYQAVERQRFDVAFTRRR